jgi:hypothetical protein
MLHLVGQRGDFQKLFKSFENLFMTSGGLGEVFEADFVDGGLSGGLNMCRTGSDDPDWRQRNFSISSLNCWSERSKCAMLLACTVANICCIIFIYF